MLFLTRTSAARSTLLLGAGLSFVAPVWAQNAAFGAAADNAATAPLQAALANGNTPLTLSTQELDGSWRRFKISKSLDTNFKFASEASEDGNAYSYLTQGETLTVGDETFLVTYRTRLFNRPPYSAIENASDVDVATNSTNPDQYLLSESFEDSEATDGYLHLFSTQTLHLCLLNVRTIDGLGDIRAFEPKTDLIKVVTETDKVRADKQALAARAQLTGDAINRRVDSDLKQIGLALLQYTQDYDEKLPPMRSSQSMADIKKVDVYGMNQGTVQQVLGPYMKAQELFAHPTTREIYRPNLNLSGRALASLDAVSQIVAFYEASPAPDGTRAVAYLDGHVKRERETDWLRIRALSDQFAPPFDFGKRKFNGNSANAAVVTPRIKTALAANAALRGSQINVDTTLDNKTVVLRGTTKTKAQRDLAIAIARKSAPGFRIVDQLNLK